MDKKSDEQFLIIQVTVDSNNQEDDGKQIKTDYKLTHII